MCCCPIPEKWGLSKKIHADNFYFLSTASGWESKLSAESIGVKDRALVSDELSLSSSWQCGKNSFELSDCNSDSSTTYFNAGLVEKRWKCWKMLNSKHPQNWTSSWAAKVTQSGLRNVQSQDAGDRHHHRRHHRHRHHCRHLHIHCHHHKKKSNKDLGRSGLY